MGANSGRLVGPLSAPAGTRSREDVGVITAVPAAEGSESESCGIKTFGRRRGGGGVGVSRTRAAAADDERRATWTQSRTAHDDATATATAAHPRAATAAAPHEEIIKRGIEGQRRRTAEDDVV